MVGIEREAICFRACIYACAMSNCALCLEDRPLLKSHIIPAFLIRWRKREVVVRTAGYIENASVRERLKYMFGRKVQDGPKLALLCAECEARLNKFETIFSKKAFAQLAGSSDKTLTYGAWLHQFCAGLIWRCVLYCERQCTEFSEWQDAMEAWRLHLLGATIDCSPYELHLLTNLNAGMTGQAPENLPENWNEFINTGFALHLGFNDDIPVAIVKVGHLVFIGIGKPLPSPDEWTDNQVHQAGGVIGGTHTMIPLGIYDHLRQMANMIPR